MGIFNGKRKAARIKARAETKAFRQLVKKRTTQAGRQAFAEEAEKVAILKAKAKARRGSIGERVVKKAMSSIRKQAKRSRKQITKRRTQAKQQFVNPLEGLF